MLTSWDLDEAIATVTAVRAAVGEPVTWRHTVGGQVVESEIRALFSPVPPGLVSAGLYLKTDLQMITDAAIVSGDQVVRFGVVYDIIEEPFTPRLGDRIVLYETKVRRA